MCYAILALAAVGIVIVALGMGELFSGSGATP
jgi:hypothetical protein